MVPTSLTGRRPPLAGMGGRDGVVLRNLTEKGATMTYLERWLMAAAMVGGVAGCAATLILWMIVTRPIALAQALANLR